MRFHTLILGVRSVGHHDPDADLPFELLPLNKRAPGKPLH